MFGIGVVIMIAKYIKLMDYSFESVEILNVKDEEDLMHKIKEGEIIKIQDGAFIYGVNSNYIMIYEL